MDVIYYLNGRVWPATDKTQLYNELNSVSFVFYYSKELESCKARSEFFYYRVPCYVWLGRFDNTPLAQIQYVYPWNMLLKDALINSRRKWPIWRRRRERPAPVASTSLLAMNLTPTRHRETGRVENIEGIIYFILRYLLFYKL